MLRQKTVHRNPQGKTCKNTKAHHKKRTATTSLHTLRCTTPRRTFSTTQGTTNPQGLIRTTLTDGKFYNKQASQVLDCIVHRIEEEDIDYAFDNEVEYTHDVLKFKTPRGTWVLNKHNVTKQIWLSSPISGPSKYNYHPPHFVWEKDHDRVWGDDEGLGGVWLSERDDATRLSALLQREWSEVFGMDVKFQQDF